MPIGPELPALDGLYFAAIQRVVKWLTVLFYSIARAIGLHRVRGVVVRRPRRKAVHAHAKNRI